MPEPAASLELTSLPASELRWRCDPSTLGFQTTAELTPIRDVIGQDEAIDALRFGLEIAAEGQNIYVRGLQGTGRLTTVRTLLEQIRPQTPPAPDHLYVYDFDHPDRPRLLTLARGHGTLFCEKLAELRQFIAGELGSALEGELIVARRRELERKTLAEIELLTKPLEGELSAAGLALVVRESAGVAQPMILPLLEGKPVAPERFAALIQQGKLSEQQLEELEQRSSGAREQVDRVFRQVGELQRRLRIDIRDMVRGEAERLLAQASTELREHFVGEGEREGVACFLDALIHDLVHRRLTEFDKIEQWLAFYEVNPISCHGVDDPPPVIVEYVPSMRALLGTVDTAILPDGSPRADHLNIRAGALLRADGGVLVMEAAELLPNPGAWSALVRTLRSGRVEHVLPELPVLLPMPSLKPEPIPIDVKVVLLGDANLYYLLDQLDNDFPHLFKVLADFDELIARDPRSIQLYAGVFARIALDEKLPAFSAAAIAELTEHGARIAATRGKLTARLGRLADIAREAAYLTRKRDPEAAVQGDDLREAVRRTKRRADGPARRFRELVADGRIRVATQGRVVGQINGLAVIQAGPLTYGFPTRITATVGTGTGGTINIERESQLSGAIHTKGFYILGGLLRSLLRTEHPLSFEASIAFEQSYGGIDGDSASGAEIVCLLSALTRDPIRQDLAMTGAIDQLGHILPIGAVNEKIEGFFDTCKAQGLTGTQGVVIPQANVGDLMLRHDVVEACARGEFRVWSVATIHAALALFFDQPAGERDETTGFYGSGSVLHRAVAAAFILWRQAQATPADFEVLDTDVSDPEG
ncbi:AAA family ATPase [Nannocystaceae bacterium ST9]